MFHHRKLGTLSSNNFDQVGQSYPLPKYLACLFGDHIYYIWAYPEGFKSNKMHVFSLYIYTHILLSLKGNVALINVK